MTITYTYQLRFFPKQWTAPPLVTDDKHDNLMTTLENRCIISVFIKDWLSVLNTWRFCIKYGVIPILILFLILGNSVSLFLILSVIVCVVSIVIWAKIRLYQRIAAMIEVVIDEVIATNLGFKPPKILEV